MAAVRWFQWGGAAVVMGGWHLGLAFGVWCLPVWRCCGPRDEKDRHDKPLKARKQFGQITIRYSMYFLFSNDCFGKVSASYSIKERGDQSMVDDRN